MADEERKGVKGKLVDAVVNQARRMAKEVGETITDKVIPQGAAELAQAIFSEGNAYVPYGPSQGPAPLEGGVHGAKDVPESELGQLKPEFNPAQPDKDRNIDI